MKNGLGDLKKRTQLRILELEKEINLLRESCFLWRQRKAMTMGSLLEINMELLKALGGSEKLIDKRG